MTTLLLMMAAVTLPAARTYPVPEAEVRQALEQLGAFEDAPLPMLEGFVALSADQFASYDRPHYQFRAELKPAGAGQTEVAVEAKITARFIAGPAVRPEYRALVSSGRLETDLLDRLSQQLERGRAPSADEVAAVRAQADAAQRRRAELEQQLRDLEPLGAPAAPPLRLVAVSGAAPVLERPAAAARALFRSEPQDEFELVSERGSWLEVRTAAEATGWIRRAKVAPAGRPEPAPAFAVDHEENGVFSGEWAPLQGKQVLFVWVRAGAGRPRWSDVKRVFADHYRIFEHLPPDVVRPAGLVVIFGGSSMSVAAATLPDVGGWLDGAISEHDLIGRCSLDPQNAFQEPEINGSRTQ